MLTDYKFWYIKRDNDGFITEVAVRFFEGEMQTVYVKGDAKNMYVRTGRLNEKDLEHLGTKSIKDAMGNHVQLFSLEDFGLIKSDDELRLFLNGELAKDKKRTPISEQK